MATTVAWVQDGNGAYEISSREHLLQVMNRGNLYTNAGTPPSSYSSSSYIQTVDIDLIDVHQHISTITLGGVYDGGNFKISNWSYTTGSGSNGLFTTLQNATIKNIRLAGVWTLTSEFTRGGFLVGYAVASSTILNCEADFAPGTTMGIGDPDRTLVYRGGLIGEVRNTAEIHGLTVKGNLFMDTVLAGQTNSRAGGVIGAANVYNDTDTGNISNVRNIATFPNGVSSSSYTGGVVGELRDYTISNILCAMKGDVIATRTNSSVGGVFANLTTVNHTMTCDNIVNSMNGNISGAYLGGIVATISVNNTGNHVFTRWMNYMTGNITSNVSGNQVGGVFGRAYVDPASGYTATLTNSISAMNGNVSDTVATTFRNEMTTLEVVVDTSFGMTFTTDSGSSTPLTGYPNDATFTDLPYTDLTATDSYGNYYDWEFIYGNLPGKSSYAAYTHLCLHKGDIAYPIQTSFDLEVSNTVFYATFVNEVNNEMFTDRSLTVIDSEASFVYDYPGVVIIFPSSLSLLPRAINIIATITPVAGSLGYRLTYQGPSGDETVARAGFTNLTVNIPSLESDTLYTVRLYVDTGGGYVLEKALQTTTLSNVSSNYVITDFLADNDVYDLKGLAQASRGDLSKNMNDLFTTGDKLQISGKKVTFVKRGEAVSAKDSLLLPFDESAGASQTVILTLDDNTSASVNYDESNDTIEVNSITYNTGDQFVLDGKKVKIFEY